MRDFPDQHRADMHVRQILGWYDQSGRDLPWRVRGAGTQAAADAYRVWLSEIMLQQTTVAAVIPYFDKFLARWPDVHALAAASLDDVLRAWAGLGYYARARNLKKCAEQVSGDLGGEFPTDEKALRALPGVGPYTAAAISAIAFGRKAVVVDGNVERVVSRLFAVETPLPGAKKELAAIAAALTPDVRPGDYAQAMMDLGATICTPKSPNCEVCPLQGRCAAAGDDAEAFPRRSPKKARPKKSAHIYWLESDGRVLMQRRPPQGLLGGMMEFPSSPWVEAGDKTPLEEHAPVPADWNSLDVRVKHVFTHFELTLWVHCAELDDVTGHNGDWQAIEGLDELALPTLMKKVARTVLD